MKKILLGSTALIAAVTLSMPASAAEKIRLGLGGKLEQYFGVVSQDDAPGFDPTVTGINTDTEVYFSGATTLDNGLTVGAMIQLEAQTNSTTNADEQYAYIEGAFGRIIAGQKDGVLTQLAHEAPQYGLADDDVAAFFNPGNLLTNYNRGVDTTLGGQDNASVSYISPSMAGFTVGATFMPNVNGALQANTETELHNQWEVGLAYNGEFSGFSIGADASYIEASGASAADAEDPWGWRAGLIVGYAGFQVGGSVLQLEDAAGNAGEDSLTWNAGVGYKTGPYGVSVVYLESDFDDPVTNDNSEYRQVSLHGSYAMGPGVTLAAAAFWAEGEQTYGAAGSDSVDGVGGIVGLQLAF